MTDTDQLCDACERVDLYSLFTGPRHSDYLNPVGVSAEIGTLENIKSNSRCPLCRLVKHELYGGNTHPWKYRDGPETKDNEECDPAKVRCILKPIRADYVMGIFYANNNTDDLVATAIHLELAAMPDCSSEEKSKIRQYQDRIGGHFKLLSPGSVDPARPLHNGFRPTTLENSLALLSTWLEGCHEHHGDTCRGQTPPEYVRTNLSLIRTVDVSTRELVEVDPATAKYAALSWVWGEDQDSYSRLANEVVVTETSVSIPNEGVPKIIEDAIQVCQAVSIPYLWVDLYCIHQNDPVTLRKLLKST